ncbi:pyridoxal phosphate-dependent aminotransferase [Sporosarcina sp. resist]|uniref:pyridoxal phosphate-dependent aminotransferase n=1 Tax=Sporosarcina sp. resist TaxID=2762563 RepID=UPI00164D3D0B|nr:pyridoxal phosphate-dependent aminotransferase [Sporosarcina sp. resist]QNK89111.1 pyridoxal phosphate-dependent aminotransferase [Sporosarcina sp. resist]
MIVKIQVQTQEAIQNLIRARNVLSGLNDEGQVNHPNQFNSDVISFADGEGMRRPYPEVIVSGVTALLETKITSLEKYFFLSRFKELDEKIKNMFIDEGISEDIANNICITTGTSHLFNAFFNSLKLDKDVVITAPGYYHSLANWCDLNNGILEIVQTEKENNYKLLKRELYKWIQSNKIIPKALVIFNPTYTGAFYTQEELMGIADFVEEFDINVIEDSLFMYTKFDDSKEIHHLSQHIKENVITVHGASKSYGLANMRIGWACGSSRIIDKMNFYVGATQVDAPHVSKVMALKALDGPESYINANKNELQRRTKLIEFLIDDINTIVEFEFKDFISGDLLDIPYIPESGHSLLISFNKLIGLRTEYGFTITDSIDISKYFLLKSKIALSPGLSMGFIDATMRMSYGCLGLNYSYESSIEIEKILILKDSLKRTNLIEEFPYLLNKINKQEKNLLLDYTNEQGKAFDLGRKIIEEGISQRLKPAIVELLRFNYQSLFSKEKKNESNSF